MYKYDSYASTAVKLAHLGGEVLLKYFKNINQGTIESKGIGDWVSEADRASEDAIVDYLAREMPTHDILTEERAQIVRGEGSEFRWIIDPLDGTTNYLRGFPIWAVSVALEQRMPSPKKWGSIVAGSVYIPILDETFHSAKGSGAFLNGKPINVSHGREFNECLFGTGFPFRNRKLVPEYSRLLCEVLEKSADVRRPGAAAVDLCYVAAGILDGFWELDLAPWDTAAGSLIIKEAGGLVSNFQGGDDFLSSGDIVAGSPTIFSPLLETVTRYFPQARDVDKSVA